MHKSNAGTRSGMNRCQAHGPGLPWARAIGGLAVLFMVVALSACSSAEERKQAYVEKARAFQAAGDLQKARLELKNALKIDPKDTSVRLILARNHAELKNWRAAVRQYGAVVSGDESNVDARVELAKIFLSGRALERATELVDEAIALAPADPRALAVKGRLLALGGDLAGARANADAALAADAGSADGIALSAQLRQSEGDADAAARELRAGLQLHPEDTTLKLLMANLFTQSGDVEAAAAGLRELIELEPDEPAHSIRLARFFIQAKMMDEAEQALADAARRHVDDATTHLAQAEFLARFRDWRKAEMTLKAFVEAHPKARKVKFALAKLYTAAGSRDDAKAIYTDIAEDEKAGNAQYEARAKLGSLLAAQGDLEGAARQVRLALDGNPRHMDSIELRAKLALLDKRVDDAIADLRIVQRDKPESESASVLTLLGRAHLAKNEVELARDYLEQAVAVNPGGANPRLLLAGLLAKSGDLEQASRQLEAGLEKAPDDRTMLQSLAQVQIGQGEWEEALKSAARLKQAYPDKPYGSYLAGRIAQARGDHGTAVAELDAALTLAPESELALAAAVAGMVSADKPREALARVEAFLDRSADSTAALRLKGGLLMRTAEHEKAHEAYAKVIAAEPKDSTAHKGLAYALMAMDRREESIDALREGVSATNSSFDLVSELAAQYERDGNVQAVIELYEDHIARHPDSLLGVNNLAMVLATHRDDASSLVRAGELAAKLRDSTAPALLDTVGWVALRRGDNQSAISVLQKVVETAPQVPVFRYHLAVAYDEGGRSDHARTELERLLADGGSEFPGIEDARKRLARLSGS